MDSQNNNNGGGFQRPKFQGNWTCKDCGTQITELPFQPRDGSTVSCQDCWRKNKPPRRFSR